METTYYLFGDSAVNSYLKDSKKGFLKKAESGEISFSIFAFEEGVTKSIDLMTSLDGWNSFVVIDNKTYNKLLEI
jgi:hypothetical protein